jgi:hypothetical protein
LTFVLSGLGIFAQTWPNVATKSHNVEEESTDQIIVPVNRDGASQLSKDFVIKRSVLPRNILFAHHVIDDDCRHIARVR